jgi:hypothetical protein
MKTFEKGLSKQGYAKHTPTLRKPKFRLTDARGYENKSVKIRLKNFKKVLSKEGHAKHALYRVN